MNEIEMREFSTKLLEEANVACLTTIDENGYPHTRGIFNLRNVKQFPTLVKVFEPHQEDLLIYISTNTSSSKVEHIKSNPKISYCVLDPKTSRGLTLGGEIEIVPDDKIKHNLWVDGWDRYYPKGITDEDYTVLKLLPKAVEIWNRGKFKYQLD